MLERSILAKEYYTLEQEKESRAKRIRIKHSHKCHNAQALS